MWICLNNAFLSVVSDRGDSTRLLVRARIKGHIERVFPAAKVTCTEDADYLYRAFIPRSMVGQVLADLADEIDYENFKDSVKEPRLHAAYMGFWQIMYRLQLALHKVKAATHPWRK